MLFPVSRLVGKAVIAVNNSIFRMLSEKAAVASGTGSPRFLTVFSADQPWVIENWSFLSSYEGGKYLATPFDNQIKGTIYLKRGYDAGLSFDPDTVHTGGNSGYAAINLAYHFGARSINLVGFDMNGPDDKFRQWIPRFRYLSLQLIAQGVRVLNHSPYSAIDAFEKVWRNSL